MKVRAKIWVAVLFVLAAVAVIPIVRHYQLKAAVDRYRAELKAKGELMELAQVIPLPVSAGQNDADTFLKAAALRESHPTFLDTNSIGGKIMVAPGKAMRAVLQPKVSEPGEYGFTNSWDEANSAIKQNEQSLALLREILQKPKLDFHLAYANGFADAGFFTNLHMVEMKRSASLLSSAAMVDLYEGNPGGAITNVIAALRLAQAMREQRLAITELVRIAMVAIAQNPTWEILQTDHLTDDQLAALQRAWERLDFVRSYRNALLMENAVGSDMLAKWRKSNAELEKYFGLNEAARRSLGMEDEEREGLFQRCKKSANIFLWRYWWSYPDELRSLQGGEVLVETARQAETNRAFLVLFQEQLTNLDELGFNQFFDLLKNPMLMLAGLNLHTMLSESVNTLSSCFKRVMSIETTKAMTVTAIALKRHQLKYGNYPAGLNSLVPEFLAAVHLDPVDGRPLRYRLNPDGSFTLYSVGENGKDDGGNPALEPKVNFNSYQWQSSHALDWVWPQPATEAEIQKYFAEHADKEE